jgi:hypothetical protein
MISCLSVRCLNSLILASEPGNSFRTRFSFLNFYRDPFFLTRKTDAVATSESGGISLQAILTFRVITSTCSNLRCGVPFFPLILTLHLNRYQNRRV